MRLSLWLILILAFFVGMGCALTLRHVHFEKKPDLVSQFSEPRTKILVATQTISSGVGITAELVAFQEVPLSEVPLGAFSSFTQVYGRQPAYPIPTGCPICEDLLLPQEETPTQITFVPAGSQLVTLDIIHIRQGEKVFSPKKPISAVLSADQYIDIRLVPRNEVQGKLAEIKNQVLQVFAAHDFRNSGELILDRVPIHQIQRQSIADSAGAAKDSLVLLLENKEAAKLSAAAKRGQIRVLVSQDTKNRQRNVEAEEIFEVAEQSPILTVSIPLEQPLPDMPLALRQSPPAPVIPAGDVTSMEDAPKTAPVPADIFDAMLPSSEPAESSIVKFQQNPEQQTEHQSVSMLAADTSEKVLVRNDLPAESLVVPSQGFPPGQPAGQSPGLTKMVPIPEPQQETPVRPLSGTIIGAPRVSQSIQFLPPGDVLSARRDRSRDAVKRVAENPLSPVVPLVIPTVPIQPETAEVPGYSPFERRFENRVYTVQPNDNYDENTGGIPTPPPLLKGSDSGT